MASLRYDGDWQSALLSYHSHWKSRCSPVFRLAHWHLGAARSLTLWPEASCPPPPFCFGRKDLATGRTFRRWSATVWLMLPEFSTVTELETSWDFILITIFGYQFQDSTRHAKGVKFDVAIPRQSKTATQFRPNIANAGGLQRLHTWVSKLGNGCRLKRCSDVSINGGPMKPLMGLWYPLIPSDNYREMGTLACRFTISRRCFKSDQIRMFLMFINLLVMISLQVTYFGILESSTKRQTSFC